MRTAICLAAIVLGALLFVPPSQMSAPHAGAATSAVFSDDFNDGNADGWTPTLGTWWVEGGRYRTNAPVPVNHVSVVSGIQCDDCTIEVTVNHENWEVGYKHGIVFRYVDTQNYYRFWISDEYDQAGFDKCYSGSPSQCHYVSVQNPFPNSGNHDYRLRVELSGADFKGYVDGVLVATFHDTDYTAGLVGVFAHRSGAAFDDFSLTVQPPTQNVVLFLQGHGSESHCTGDADDGPTEGYRRISWLTAYLRSKTELSLSSDSFLYYDYTSGSNSPLTCPGEAIPDYRCPDACLSLNETYWDRNELHSVDGHGEGYRLAKYINDYLTAHPDVRLALVGHSQGGVLAVYATTFNVLTDDNLRKIQAIVTLDSPLGGVLAVGASALEQWESSGSGCRTSAAYDAATDMVTGKETITRIASPRTSLRLFTVDGLPGNVGPFELVETAHATLPWATGSLVVSAPQHGDVFDGPMLSEGRLSGTEAAKIESLVYCAMTSSSGSCGDPKVKHVPNHDVAEQEAPVAEGSAKLKAHSDWDGSTVSMTLVSPSGRRIDQTTVADDVSHSVDTTSETIEVTTPEPGTWTVELYGTDVPPEGEDAVLNVVVSPDSTHDADADGVFDAVDNCPGVSNASQTDSDLDGLGDACDPDIDGDGIANDSDNCPTVANADQVDSDHNGMGDACDPGGVIDSDADEVVDNLDNCPLDYNPDQANVDGDAWGDVCDLATDAPVGGIADLPDTTASARATAESSRGSSTPYAPIAGAAAGGALLLVAGGWYSRRRWPSRR